MKIAKTKTSKVVEETQEIAEQVPQHPNKIEELNDIQEQTLQILNEAVAKVAEKGFTILGKVNRIQTSDFVKEFNGNMGLLELHFPVELIIVPTETLRANNGNTI